MNDTVYFRKGAIMESKNILAICGLPILKTNVELHKAFIYTLWMLSKQHNVKLVIHSLKQNEVYFYNGWLKIKGLWY
jgi:hypothetical protein